MSAAQSAPQPTDAMPYDFDTAEFRRELGMRLRQARIDRGLVLRQVELAMGSTVTVEALRTYERGSRSISLITLLRLSAFYRTDIRQLLPTDMPAPLPSPVFDRNGPPRRPSGRNLILDADAVRAADTVGWAPLIRYVHAVDPAAGRRVFVLSPGQLANLAAIFRTTVVELIDRLADSKLVAMGHQNPDDADV